MCRGCYSGLRVRRPPRHREDAVPLPEAGEDKQAILPAFGEGDRASPGVVEGHNRKADPDATTTTAPTPLPTRFATAADIPALHALVERSYRGISAREGWTHEADLISGPRTDVKTLAATIADSAQRVLLYEDSGKLLASVTLTDHGDGVAYMGMLAVEPGRQGGGIGRAMLAAAERAAAAEFGARIIEMKVITKRTELVAYYERCGYAQTGERRPFPVDVGPDRDALEMTVLARELDTFACGEP